MNNILQKAEDFASFTIDPNEDHANEKEAITAIKYCMDNLTIGSGGMYGIWRDVWEYLGDRIHRSDMARRIVDLEFAIQSIVEEPTVENIEAADRLLEIDYSFDEEVIEGYIVKDEAPKE